MRNFICKSLAIILLIFGLFTSFVMFLSLEPPFHYKDVKHIFHEFGIFNLLTYGLSFFFFKISVKSPASIARIAKREKDNELKQIAKRNEEEAARISLEERNKNEKYLIGEDYFEGKSVELINVLLNKHKFVVYSEKYKKYFTYTYDQLLDYEVKINDTSVQWKSLGAGLLTGISNAGMRTRKKVSKITVYLKLKDFDNPLLPINIYSGFYIDTSKKDYVIIEERLLKFTTYLDIILEDKKSSK